MTVFKDNFGERALCFSSDNMYQPESDYLCKIVFFMYKIMDSA